MGKGFTNFKDRIWFLVDSGSRGIAVAPAPIQAVGYGTLRGILWTAFHLPKAPLKPTAQAFAWVLGRETARGLYGAFVDRFVWALRRTERLRLGHFEETDAAFAFPEKERLDGLLKSGKGAVLVFPHCHASLLAVRGLTRSYDVLLLVREPIKKARAEAMRVYYENLEAERLDVRNTPDIAVARKVVSALRKGRLVVGVVDRIKDAPPEDAPYSRETDMHRVTAFGQPVGAVGWPARFAGKLGSPIVPCIAALTPDVVQLQIEDAVLSSDERKATQDWMDALVRLFHRFPYDWGFAYDKFWARVLKSAAHEPVSQSAAAAPQGSAVR